MNIVINAYSTYNNIQYIVTTGVGLTLVFTVRPHIINSVCIQRQTLRLAIYPADKSNKRCFSRVHSLFHPIMLPIKLTMCPLYTWWPLNLGVSTPPETWADGHIGKAVFFVFVFNANDVDALNSPWRGTRTVCIQKYVAVFKWKSLICLQIFFFFLRKLKKNLIGQLFLNYFYIYIILSARNPTQWCVAFKEVFLNGLYSVVDQFFS